MEQIIIENTQKAVIASAGMQKPMQCPEFSSCSMIVECYSNNTSYMFSTALYRSYYFIRIKIGASVAEI
jgi:hypothetical protein